MPDPKAA
jgi:hypothetical protein